MAFCANCGASVEGRFCAKCGTPIGTAAAGASAPMGGGGVGPMPGATASAPPPPGAQPYAATPTSGGLTENLAGALCYILGLITGVLFLVLAPYNQSKFVRFHAFQAIFFHVSWIALWIVDMIISIAMPWGLQMVTSLLWIAIALGGLFVWLFLMYKAYNNERFKLPIIGDLAEKQA
jgi:uncharacterized membrane protein